MIKLHLTCGASGRILEQIALIFKNKIGDGPSMKTADPHEYAADLIWEGNLGNGTADYSSYSRRFRVLIQNKPDLVGTADVSFRGEPDKHNPEDLLVAAIVSCHMLSYLALCARNGITVVEYKDEARATLKLLPNGGGSFEEVTLHPRVTIKAGSDQDLAYKLHAKAHELCFIANSCNFPVHHQATICVK
jgi:organic hydroperoxide reductase OsmC/OhrA